ncbi:MAG TPA: TonB family protein [Mucilaginibacter sp.]|nr:TonB family protein [Mucilaginibacter sp.]
MNKYLLTLLLVFSSFFIAHSQDRSLIYYLKNTGQLVSTKDSADYWMIVSPPDSSADDHLYIVREYNKDGKIRLQTTSKTNDLNLTYDGKYIAYYPDGRKMRSGAYVNGKFSGPETEYYPNGNIYNIKDYQADGSVRFEEYRDSTGAQLAENGNGTWVEFDRAFKDTTATGKIRNGLMDGVWKGKVNDTIRFENIYVNGKMKEHHYWLTSVSEPYFYGGVKALMPFLAKTIRYPMSALRDRTDGTVVVSFVVETDGSLSDIKVLKPVSPDLDAEAVRVMKLSPKWVPASKDGHPIRKITTFPIKFSIN